MATLTGKCAGCGRKFEVLPAARYGLAGSTGLPAQSRIGRSVCSRRCELAVEHKDALVARGVGRPFEISGRDW